MSELLHGQPPRTRKIVICIHVWGITSNLLVGIMKVDLCSLPCKDDVFASLWPLVRFSQILISDVSWQPYVALMHRYDKFLISFQSLLLSNLSLLISVADVPRTVVTWVPAELLCCLYHYRNANKHSARLHLQPMCKIITRQWSSTRHSTTKFTVTAFYKARIVL